MITGNLSTELFSITGISRRSKLFFKKKNHITVYSEGIEITIDSENEFIPLNAIYNIYIKEPITAEVPERTTVIEYYEDGEESQYDLDDELFEKLSYRMEKLLSNEWSHLLDKKRMTNTEKWFNAAFAIFMVSDERDLNIWGGMYVTPDVVEGQREVLAESWNIHNASDADDMIESLLGGRANNEYLSLVPDIANCDYQTRVILNTIQFYCSKNGIKAWDWVRVFNVAVSSYLSGYYTREKALDQCLRAALKLQSTFSSWDDMGLSYVHGYGFWSKESIDNSKTEAYDRYQIHEHLKKLANSPYNNIDWSYPITREW